MPKFHLYDLPLININNDYHIELDNIPYNEYESYTKVSIISFTNKYGHVILKGFFDLTKKNIPSLININKLSFEISKQLLNSCKYNFCKYTLEIEFYFSYDDIKLLKNIEKYLINEYNCSIDYLLGVNKENVSPDLLDLLRNIIIYDFKQRDPLSDLLHISETDHYIDIKTELDEDVLFKTNATVRFYTYGKTNYVGMLLNGYLKLKEALRLDLIDEDMSMKMIEELINRFRPELSSTDNQAIDSPFK